MNEGLIGEFDVKGLNIKEWVPDETKIYIKPMDSKELVEDVDELEGFVDLIEETGETLIVNSWSFKIQKA